MVWRAYYTLKDAAAELSREFNDTYTEADLIHYGAIGIADLCLNVFLDDENIAHIATVPMPGNIEGGKSQRFITSIMPEDFLLIPKYSLKELEAKGSAAISSFEYLKKEDGEKISPLNITSDFYQLSEIEEKFLFFRIIKSNIHFQNVSDTSGEILPPNSSGYTDSKIIISYQDPCITQADLSRLKITLKNKELKIISEKEKQADDRKTLLNIIYALKTTLLDKQVFLNQAGVIEYLSSEFDMHGLSESNLKTKFAEANRQEKSN